MKRSMISSAALVLALAVSSGAFAQDQTPPAAVPVAQPTENEAPAAKAAPARAKKSDLKTVSALSVTVEIVGGTQLRGTLVDASQLPMRTSFGQADIPLSEVAGIRLANKDDAVTTVVLHNGDSITGATNLPHLIVETEWGTADITGSSISNILFAPDLKWSASEGLNGNRWTLSDAPKEEPARQTNQAQPVSRPLPQPVQSPFINRGF